MMTGSAKVLVDGEMIIVRERQCAAMYPGKVEFWQFSPDLPVRHTWVALKLAAISEDRLRRIELSPRLAPVTNRLLSIVELGLGTSLSGSTERWLEALAVSAVECFLLDSTTKVASEPPDAVRGALRYMEAHLQESFDLAVLAASVGMSAQHLTRMFRQHLGDSPMHYLWRLRAERGATLLEETSLRVSEISHRTGFQSPSHFSRLIQSVYGLSPRELRISSRQDGPDRLRGVLP
ncbi:helix-turn-helix domain-containing protein [Fimbriimonas ginsengisoli]|nr:helix-turn-helix domain-containing protein [Fimbriimonas ginsengisoli]